VGGIDPTLNAGDSVTATGLKNLLSIVDTGTGGIPVINLSGIQTVRIKSDEGVVVDATPWVGLTRLDVTASNGDDIISVGDSVALSVVDASGNVTTNGGTSVKVQADALATVAVNGGATTSTVMVTGGNLTAIHDSNFGSGNPNSISSVSLVNTGATTTIESNALTSLAVTGFATFGTVRVVSAAGTRALGLTLSGDAGTAVSDSEATTVNVKAISSASTGIQLDFGAASSIAFDNTVALSLSALLASTATSLKISGPGDFSCNIPAVATNCAIDATSSSGAVKLALLGSESFKGGSGQDTLTVFGIPQALITGGSNAHNEIILVDAGATDQTAIDPSLVSHFSTFGVGGSTRGIFDMSALPAYTSFETQGVGGDVTFAGVASRSQLLINDGSYIGVVTLKTADTHGAADTVTLRLNVDTPTSPDVVLQDANGNGIGTIDVAADGPGTNSVGLDTSIVSTLKLSGSGDLAIEAQNPLNGIVNVIGGSDDADIQLFITGESCHVSLGRGSNFVFLGTGSSTESSTLSYGAHAGGADTTILGSTPSLAAPVVISGAALGDALKLASVSAFDNAAVTAAQVTAAGGSTATLAGWVNGAFAFAGNDMSQGHAGWFQFDGATYVVSQTQAAGTAFGAGDAIVKLVGLYDLSGGSFDSSGLANLIVL
jgi:hypothetical protein